MKGNNNFRENSDQFKKEAQNSNKDYLNYKNTNTKKEDDIKKNNSDEDNEEEMEGYEKDSFIVSDNEDDESDFENQKRKKNRKKKKKIIQDELNSEDEHVMNAYKEKTRRLKKIEKLQSNYIGEQIKSDYDKEEEMEEELEEEKRKYIGKEIELNELFEPQDLIDNYETETDRQILEKDMPERLYFRNKKMSPDNKELLEETNWIVKKLLRERNILQNNSENLQFKVLKILEFLKLFHFEIMYIWYHKNHEFTNYNRNNNEYELKLNDLWFIYDMDLKWNEISQKKKQIQKLLDIIIKKLEIPQNQINQFLNFFDRKSLDYLEEYLDYQFNKLFDDFEIKILLNQEHSSIKKISKRNLSREIYKNNIHKIAYAISLSPEQLAENLEKRSQIYKPVDVKEQVDSVATKHTKGEISYLSDPVKTLRTICEFIAKEYFYHPTIKRFLQKLYTDRITINTEPTIKGKKMNVYNYYFPTKRIKDKKPFNINLELWLLMLESEQKGLIKIKLNFGNDSENKKQEIINTLSQYILQNPSKTTGPRFDWDIVREEIIKKLLNIMIPYFEKDLFKEITETAKNHLLNICGNEFRTIIDMKPYRKNDYVKVLACTMDEKENAIFGIINEEGYLISYLTLLSILKKPKDNDHSQKILYQKDKESLENFIQKHLPDTIIMSPESMKSYNLKIDELSKITDEVFSKIDKEKPFDMWTNLKISKIYAKSNLSKRLNPDLTQPLKELISMGRYVQNPLAETLNLWSEDVNDNILLYINYHPQQNILNRYKLRNHLENIILEIVNSKGVDINSCLKFPHLAQQLQFVCGLGPRKSRKLLENIKNSEIGGINERKDLENTFLGKNVYENCAAFIKIDERIKIQDTRRYDDKPYNWLDFTRIHPQNYQMAIKIAKEALDNPNSNDQTIILRIFKDGSKIEELDLDDFANHLTEQYKCNMHNKINFIKEELINPFKDLRKDFNTKFNDDDIFYALTNESKYKFKEESILTVKLVSIDDNGLKFVTNNGLLGVVSTNDVNEHGSEYKPSEFKKRYRIGQFLRAKIKNINYQHIKVRLSIREDDLTNHKEYLRKNHILEKFDLVEDNNFLIYKEDDFPIFNIENKKKIGKFVPRKINHPNFKNVGLGKAIDFLFDKNQGNYLFRPSSKGIGYINLTWKYYGDITVHLMIKEGHKSAKENISSNLILDKQSYESLDEIIENFIKPCNMFVRSISQFTKFVDKPIDYVKETLKEKRAQNQSKIPYFFSFVKEKPQFLILSYILEKRVKHELIKIKPDGLHFHGMAFSNLALLTKYFKENLKTEDYQNFVKRLPRLDLGKKKTQISIKEEAMKNEYREKRKDRYKNEPRDYDRDKRYRDRGDRRYSRGERGDRDRGDRDRGDRDRGDRDRDRGDRDRDRRDRGDRGNSRGESRGDRGDRGDSRGDRRHIKDEYDERDRYRESRNRDYGDNRRRREKGFGERDGGRDMRRDYDERERGRRREHRERNSVDDKIKMEKGGRRDMGGVSYSPFNQTIEQKDDIPDIKFEQA